MRLTAKERILLHLLDYVRFRDAIEVPQPMTQEGIASAAWVELRHLSQYLRPVLEDELVRERTCHVEGIRQRRKVYDLTEKGQHAAYRLRERVAAAHIQVREGHGVRDATLAEIVEASGGTVALLSLVRRGMQGGVVDLSAPQASSTSPFVEMLAEAPRVERFVGRAGELGVLVSDGPGPGIVVIRGVPGIGKSSVAAKACEQLRGRRHLFWHTVRSWDTRGSVLVALGEFLSAMDKPGLRAVASRGDAAHGADILREDLRGTGSVLVFDDAHEAGPEVLALLRFLKDAIAGDSGVRILVLTRRALSFYDRRDVSVTGIVREVELAGLTHEDIEAFLAPGMDASIGKIGQRLGGHPLFLQLIRSTPHAPTREGALRDMHRFLEEEVYADLSEPERRAMKIASLYQVPVPRAAIASDASITHDVLLSLANRSLLRVIGADAVEMHETIRGYFADVLTPSETATYARFAVSQLRELAARADAQGAFRACIDYLSNAIRLPGDSADKATMLEFLGDENERMGDFPAALTAFKEAAKFSEAPSDARARLHRKTAAALEARGEVAGARRELEAGRKILGGNVTVETGWLDLVRSRVASREETPDEAREAAKSALDVFDAFHETPAAARSLYELGYIEMDAHPSNLAAAERYLEQGFETAQRIGDRPLMAKFHMGLANLYAGRRGDVERGLEHIAAVEADPDALEDPQIRRSFRMLQGWFQLDIRADFAAAERSFEEAGDLARSLHFAPSLAFTQYGLALCHYYRGGVHEACEEFGSFGKDILAQGFPAFSIEALLMMAECHLRLGDLPAFRRIVAEIGQPAFAEGRRARPVRVEVLRAVERVLQGDLPGARTGFEAALRLAGSGDVVEEALLLHIVHFYWGVALRVLGSPKEAGAHLEESRNFLRQHHLNARLSILSVAERELTETFARAGAANPRS